MTLGAGVSYDDVQATLDAEFPHLSDYWRRIGGWQVRAMGTVGGNIANGSPIGDTPPALIALGATVTLRKGAARRTLPLEDFFIAYGKQDRQPGEFVERSSCRGPRPGTLNAAYKITKRRDEDISAVACGFQVALRGRHGRARRGSPSAAWRRRRSGRRRPRRRWSASPGREADGRGAEAALAEDFKPITDWRASADYRAHGRRGTCCAGSTSRRPGERGAAGAGGGG